ncbi:MAG: cupin domain-containing protein [Armatimonadetes bacterium]|nr:cupin domain-containing protein [Armatimonadota bacterium]
MSEAVANTPFAEVFQDRNIQIELYAPDKRDKQTPHDRDEVYLVISGSGRFRKGDEVVHFGPGDLIYVPKHEDHRFEEFTNDFKTWVIFYE